MAMVVTAVPRGTGRQEFHVEPSQAAEDHRRADGQSRAIDGLDRLQERAAPEGVGDRFDDGAAIDAWLALMDAAETDAVVAEDRRDACEDPGLVGHREAGVAGGELIALRQQLHFVARTEEG